MTTPTKFGKEIVKAITNSDLFRISQRITSDLDTDSNNCL